VLKSNYIYILLYILKKELYTKYSSFLYSNIQKEEKPIQELYKFLHVLYEKLPARESFSVEEFVAFVKAQAPEDKVLCSIAEQLLTVEMGEDVLEEIVLEAKHRALAYETALVAIDVSEGKRKYEDLLTKFGEFDTIDVPTEEIQFVTDDLEELYEHNVSKQGLRWRLHTLNEMLGSLRKGDFGFLFARPESGKTTFLASEVSFFAQQVETPILWFNNEEQGEKVQLRCYQATIGAPLEQLWADVQGNRARYEDLTGNRIKIVDSANIYKRDVDRIVKAVQPSLIVFDQIDKVKGFDADREDLRLGSIYQWARELAKTYCPVIGVTQADGSGEGKKWLTMENVANAKTAKQAEADWILGIGKTNTEGYEYVRHLHLSKNKLAGDTDSIPELRHGRRDVIIEPHLARYRDVK